MKGLSKSEFKELLSLATTDLHFIFDGNRLMVFLGPTLANAFSIKPEKNWLESCPLELTSFY